MNKFVWIIYAHDFTLIRLTCNSWQLKPDPLLIPFTHSLSPPFQVKSAGEVNQERIGTRHKFIQWPHSHDISETFWKSCVIMSQVR